MRSEIMGGFSSAGIGNSAEYNRCGMPDREIVFSDNETRRQAVDGNFKLEEIRRSTVLADDKKISAIRQYFSPAEELSEIRKAGRVGKRARIESFREGLAEQKLGNALVNSELERMILTEDVFDRSAADALVTQAAQEYGWNPTVVAGYARFLDEIEKRKKNIKHFAEKYQDRSGADFFQDLFGFAPVGEIEIKQGSISFHIICNDLRDYAKICGETTEQARLSEGFAGGKVLFPELRGATTFINGNVLDGLSAEDAAIKSETIWEHEDQHTIDRIVGDVAKLISPESPSDSLADLRVKYEDLAKNEILAFIKDDENDMASIEDILLRKKQEKGVYDYFEAHRNSEEYPQFDNAEASAVFHKEFEKVRTDYEDTLKKALEAVGLLEAFDFPKEEIIGLLQTEKLASWSKVLRRIISNPEMRERREELIKKIDEDIVEIKSDIENEEELLAKNRKGVSAGQGSKDLDGQYAIMAADDIVAKLTMRKLKHLNNKLSASIVKRNKIIEL